MRVPFVNEAIMEVMLDNNVPVKYCGLTDGRYIFSDEGFLAYVLNENEIFFSLAKCLHKPDAFRYLKDKAPAISKCHLLTETMDVRVGKNGAMLTRLKAANWDTFVDMDLLEAFDYPNFYQAEKIGIITVTEGPAGTPMETIRGHVMPVRTGLETAGHYKDKGTQE